ncbi:MAG: sensor histidine kinase [Clostridia bacterium]
MNKLLAYLKYRLILLLFYIISVFFVLFLSYLGEQNMQLAWYTVELLSFFLLIILLVDGTRFIKKLKALDKLTRQYSNLVLELPEPSNAQELCYTELLCELERKCGELKQMIKTARSDSMDYYTLWIHQIKTPISALKLVLQSRDDSQAGIIRQELFKIERYAELALRYVKLTDISSDLVIEHCDLNSVVHESVKKYGLLFVYGKLSVDIQPLADDVISDRKWLAFIIEQLLSNAVKYTHDGGVTIYMDGASLVIEDSGIGIRAQDLPRIFEKGYTGYNGRIDERASGIGLYLCRRTAEALSIDILVRSKVGKGTAVTLRFPDADTFRFM